MTRFNRDRYPFHRQGDCQGYTPPPVLPPRQHWLVTIGVMLGWGVILAAGVGVMLPIIRWAIGSP
jgi:hypothetical protein